MKNTFTAVSRITVGLVFLWATTWLAAHALGIAPDARRASVQNRIFLTEQAAVNCSLFASRNDSRSVESSLQAMVERNPNIVSAALRRKDGSLAASAGDHEHSWRRQQDGQTDASNMKVKVFANGSHWGQVEICFAPLPSWSLATFWRHPMTAFFLFCGSLSALLFSWFLRRVLIQLDPSQAVPDRVRHALDTFAEGVVVVDNEERIVLANCAFAKAIAYDGALVGRSLSELPWEQKEDAEGMLEEFPWQSALSTSQPQLGQPLTTGHDEQRRYLRVNASPILSDQGTPRGALVSFEDITEIENKKARLIRMVAELRSSREQIREQNHVLKVLATTDSLTGCLNRRAFFERFDAAWSTANDRDSMLSCIMVDIDFFKSINDDHGHAMGDAVLKSVGDALRQRIGDEGWVGRYGGEEFCVLLPGADAQRAAETAETLRMHIADMQFDGLAITASFGVTGREYSAADSHELLAQADKSLYVAKSEGRNQVVLWSEEFDSLEEEQLERGRPGSEAGDAIGVSSGAVSALFSAISYRDLGTALHCIRVADYAVRLGAGRMGAEELFALEAAALLHDIGKIGVPDAILSKPGKLTEEEWRIMRRREAIGCDIIQASFDCPQLYDFVRLCQQPYRSTENDDTNLPLGARVIAVADAFDSMTVDSPHRSALTHEAAFAELRRSAGRQLDPDLVESFIELIQSGRDQEPLYDIDSIRQRLSKEGIGTSGALGFNNTYALGMSEKRAQELGITKISQLREHPDLRLGFSDEFVERSDGWVGLKAKYHLPQSSYRALDHSLAYRGVWTGSIDVVDLYSTDPEIISFNLRVLEDDLAYFPIYEAVVLYRKELEESQPELIAQFRKLEGKIDAATMSALNKASRIDRKPEQMIASEFLHEHVDPEIAVPDLEANYWQRRFADFGENTLQHTMLVAISLSLAILCAIPLGILVYQSPGYGAWILAVVGVIQTIPSMALMVFIIPFAGLGPRPAILSLFLYSLLPIVRGTHTGLSGLSPNLKESALALGLSSSARLRLIELPLAAQSILSGIKTSAVINVGTATIGALIGAGGYGQPIITGIRLADVSLILQGAIPAAVMALLAQAGFGWLEKHLVPAGLRIDPSSQS